MLYGQIFYVIISGAIPITIASSGSVGWTEFKCPNGHMLSQLESIYHQWDNDQRMYSFGCSALSRDPVAVGRCVWTKPAYTSYGDMFLACGRNRYVAGVSILKQGLGDEWKLRCCDSRSIVIKTRECFQSHLLNEWHGNLKFSLPPKSVSRTWQSIYDDRRRDRRWWLEICPYDVISVYSATNRVTTAEPDLSTTITTFATPTSMLYTTDTTTEADLAASLEAYYNREAEFQRMLSSLAGSSQSGPVFPQDSWYPFLAGNFAAKQKSQPDVSLINQAKHGDKPLSPPQFSRTPLVGHSIGHHGLKPLAHRPNEDSWQPVDHSEHMSNPRRRPSDLTHFKSTEGSEPVRSPNSGTTGQRRRAPRPNSESLPPRPRIHHGYGSSTLKNAHGSAPASFDRDANEGLPPRPKLPIVNELFSFSIDDEPQTETKQNSHKSRKSSNGLGKLIPNEAEKKGGKAFLDFLGGASDFLSNMQDGVKFAFSDDEGNFNFKDGISTTLDYLGLCGSRYKRRK